MADSNVDRLRKMFDILAPALNEFISRTIDPELAPGHSWIEIVSAVEKNPAKPVHAGDPAVQLKLLSQNYTGRFKPAWYPFRGVLDRIHEAYAGELLQLRHQLAHHRGFTDDDSYRALDTAERLLSAIGASQAAADVAKIRLNLRRVTAERDDKRALKDAVTNPASDGLRPWREVLQPHDDVATGKFQASEFAADLYKVANQSPDQDKEYADPVEFFRRTYLTEGLRDLISRAVRRLSGDDTASPVINLQTNFGGGKTHSMLALWHLAAGARLGDLPQEVRDLLASSGYDELSESVRRVAIVGNHFAPSGEQRSADIRVRTVWGELAWQLGGADGYAMVAQADRTSTPPGRALHTLLERYAPAVILIDEWVAYARSLLDRQDLEGGTFDDQFTFAQALTEAVKGTSGVLLAISIPASHSDAEPVPGSAEEVGGAHGLEALRRLQSVVRRVADQWRPASSDEAYHIVRQRLFVNPDAAALAVIGETARRFGDYYRRHHDEFPREARNPEYEDRIKRTYPIHPELFDRLYEDWSSLERFQQTRGVLRLMNAVIHALWVGEDASPLIMPGSIPFATSAVNTEITQYLPDSWKAVIDADVDGPGSEPARIDAARPIFGQRSLTKRLARTVFFGAAPTIGTAQKGLETQRVFLGTAVPGDVPGNFHAALTQLGDRATYFYSGSGKYWYDLQANISRRAKDQAERLHKEDVWAEIRDRLRREERHRGDFAAVQACPEDTADIRDIDEVRLVLLHPRHTHKRNDADSDAMVFARAATESRGNANRINRNMLVYLAADQDRMAELDTAVRDYLGWSHVLKHSAELDLTENQRNQADDKCRQANDTINARLISAYQWILLPVAPNPEEPFVITATRAEGQAASLADRVSKRLGNDGTLSTEQAAANIRLALNHIPDLWKSGHVTIGELWAVYAAYPYMPRLRDSSVLHTGAAKQPLLWEQDGFALAQGYAERYEGLWLPTDGPAPVVTDAVLIVQPARAVAQREADIATSSNQPAGEGEAERPEPAQPEPTELPRPVKTRFFGTRELNSDRYAVDFKKISDEVLSHLAAAPGVRLIVRIDIEATTSEGFDDAQIRTISENANQLKFDQSGFEEG